MKTNNITYQSINITMATPIITLTTPPQAVQHKRVPAALPVLQHGRRVYQRGVSGGREVSTSPADVPGPVNEVCFSAGVLCTVLSSEKNTSTC